MALKVMTVVGARPQFVKAAPVARASTAGIEEIMVHTGQHFDANMSEIFFEELEIAAPAYNLDIHGGGHGAMTGRMLAALEQVFETERPGAVLIYGDTNSTLAGALAASKLHIPVLTSRPGCARSTARCPRRSTASSPITWAPCCSRRAPRQSANLANEGITRGVHVVGDVMQDATLSARGARATGLALLESLAFARAATRSARSTAPRIPTNRRGSAT